MKAMRIILVVVYLVLIILLLLLNLKSCEQQVEPQLPEKVDVPTDTTIVTPPLDPINEDSIPQEKRDSLYDSAREVGGMGELKVTLQWDFKSDIDLHAEQPDGKEIYYNERCGILDVDDLGNNPKYGRAFPFGENVTWTSPAKGTYRIWVVFYGGDESGNCYITVMKSGQQHAAYELYLGPENENQRFYIRDIIID